MKKTFTILILTAFLSLNYFNANAKVWRLNNMGGAEFSDFGSAYSAANAGDTIYVEGSTYGYGNVYLYKPLVILGTGYFLSENSKTQKTPFLASMFSSIYLLSGSEGSVISGLFTSDLTIECSNISILRNYIQYVHMGCSWNIKIAQNYLVNIGEACVYGNVNINNNCIAGSVNFPDAWSGIIINNTFITTCNHRMPNFLIANNIFYSNNWNVEVTGNSFSNNICGAGYIPSGNNNQTSIDISTLFIGTGSTDGQWQLKPGSPAIGAGIDGVDCGMFGGDEPYVLSGMPAIPSVYEFTTAGTGSNNSGLNVHVKAKTH